MKEILVNILPKKNNTLDIGSSTKIFSNVFLDSLRLNGDIKSINGNTLVKLTNSVLPVNNIEIKNSNTGIPVEINALGTDSNIDLNISSKGTGTVNINKLSLGTVLPISSGGTGGSTQPSAINNLLPSQSTNSGKAIITDGTNVSWDFVYKLYKENLGTYVSPTASGTNAISIGTSNVSSGLESVVLGGSSNTSSSTYSSSIGNNSKSNLYGGFAQSSGSFSTQGDSQTRVLVMRVVTTNNTSTEMFLDGSSQRLVLPDDTTWQFRISIVSRRTDANNESAGYELVGVIDRNTGVGTVALVGTRTRTTVAEDNIAWQVDCNADTTNGSLRVLVTGENGKTIRWVARVELVEVTG